MTEKVMQELSWKTYFCGCALNFVCCVLQKDPGFDRGQFHKQVAVMRGQVSCVGSEHIGLIQRHHLGSPKRCMFLPRLFWLLDTEVRLTHYTFSSILL